MPLICKYCTNLCSEIPYTQKCGYFKYLFLCLKPKLKTNMRKKLLNVFIQNLLKKTLPLVILLSPTMVSAQKNQKGDLSHVETKAQATPYFGLPDNPAVVYLNAIHILATSPEYQSDRKPVSNFAGKKMYMIKFKQAIQTEWYKMLTDAGAEIVDYIPNYCYLIYANYATINTLQNNANSQNSPIQWDGEYYPSYRISPNVYEVNNKGVINKNVLNHKTFYVQLFANEESNKKTIELLETIKTAGSEISIQKISHYVNIQVELDLNALQQISTQNDVISIQPYITPTKNDEKQCIVMTGDLAGNVPVAGNYLTYLANHGFTQAQFDASNFVVNVTDDGLDNGSIGGVLNATRHFGLFTSGNTALSSRVVFVRKTGTAIDADTKGCSGHGNLNTHIIGGFVPDALLGNSNHTDIDNYRYGLGVAPFVKVGNSTIFRLNGGAYSNPNIPDLESASYNDGGRISSNSWGAPVGGAYDVTAQTYDFMVRDAQPVGAAFPNAGNQEMVIVFSAGNSGSGSNTIGSPGTSKNVITVGASEGVRAFGGNDGCSISDAQANSANDIIGFSSRGPCDDGRVKPDLVTCGTHVTGGVFPSSVGNAVAGSGTADGCYDGSSVCGGVGSTFFPAGQEWTSASSGTSHSTPAVAGFAALIRQNFINKGMTAPSPAMTKAMMMVSAGYMNGVGANDNLYSNSQGMGTVNMNNYFSIIDNPNMIRDQQNADMFTSTGQEFLRTGVVDNIALPVKITLAYTDAPGPTNGNSFVNNLDLEVTVGGNTYLGNIFTASLSNTGGVADNKNNVESVFLPIGTSGPISIKVKATNIAGDGVPNNASPLDQDFSIIVSNFVEQLVPIASSPGSTVIAESCGTGLVLDPQDHITVSLPITNTGNLATTNLVATLQNTGGIIFPTAPQSYGIIAPGNNASNNFSFFVDNSVTCGETVTLTWDLLDGINNLGTIVQVMPVGAASLVPTISENFDAVAIPALPVGWTQSQLTGTAINWITTTTNPNSAPNVVFANDANSISATSFESPSFLVQKINATIDFQKSFVTENGFDGVVFEIKIGAGPWTDIITAGGSFASGGYNATISNGFSSPIAGRDAWSGSFAPYSQTVVNLPAAAFGENVQVRWIMASDVSVGSTGFAIDDININASVTCTPCLALPLDLLSFEGRAEEGYNNLTWKTANELNTSLFELEYALDANNFKKVYTVSAKGSGNNAYSQKDNGIWIANNKVFYRLKMIDIDGKFKYSNVINIQNSSSAILHTEIYPNPATKSFTLNIADNTLLGSTAQLFDSRGVLLQNILIKYNATNIDINQYASGIYLLKLNNGEVLRVNKQ